MNIIFIDLETSGLDPTQHEILEVGLAYKGQDHLWREESYKIKMEHPEKADSKALEINGYSEYKWKHAQTLQDFLPSFLDRLGNFHVIGGQCVNFDVNFIIGQAKKLGLGDLAQKKVSRRLVDTTCLAYEHCVPYGLKSLSLKNICDWLDIPQTEAHTALGDIKATVAIYDKLCRCTEIERRYWGIKNKIKKHRSK